MRVLRRGLWRIFNQKSKSLLILGLVSLVLSMLMIASGIRNAVDQAIFETKKQLTSEILLNYNFEKLIESGNSDDAPTLNDQTIEKITKLKNVVSVKYDTILPIKTSLPQVTSQTYDEMIGSGTIQENSELKTMNLPTNQLFGLDNPKEQAEFKTKEIEIMNGIFPIESKEPNSVMISQQYAEKNQLKLGDELPIETPSGKVNLKVVGIAKINKQTKEKGALFEDPYSSIANRFFMKKNEVKKLAINENRQSVLSYDSLGIQVNEIDNSQRIIAELKKELQKEWDYLNVSSDFEEFSRVTKSISNVKTIANMILIVTIVAGLLILCLVMFLTMKDRKFEIGLLLSIGETKRRVYQQIVLESLLIFIVSFLLSIVASQFVATSLSNYLLNDKSSEIVETNKTEEKSSNIVVDQQKKEIKKQPTIEKIEVKIIEYPILLFSGSSGLTILLFSVLLAMVGIVKKDPQKILIDNH